MFRASGLREYLQVVRIARDIMEGKRLEERLALSKVGSCIAVPGNHGVPLSARFMDQRRAWANQHIPQPNRSVLWEGGAS